MAGETRVGKKGKEILGDEKQQEGDYGEKWEMELTWFG